MYADRRLCHVTLLLVVGSRHVRLLTVVVVRAVAVCADKDPKIVGDACRTLFVGRLRYVPRRYVASKFVCGGRLEMFVLLPARVRHARDQVLDDRSRFPRVLWAVWPGAPWPAGV